MYTQNHQYIHSTHNIHGLVHVAEDQKESVHTSALCIADCTDTYNIFLGTGDSLTFIINFTLAGTRCACKQGQVHVKYCEPGAGVLLN